MKYLDILKKDLLKAGKLMYDRGYVVSNEGNISVRANKNSILITASGVCKGCMKSQDIVMLDLKGNVLKGNKKPSSELNMHLQIYKARPDVHCICHAHPPYATAFAVAGLPLDEMILPEVIIYLNNIPLVDYATPGTKKVFHSISKYIKSYDAMILANHGVITLGKDILNAYYKMEIVEHAAKIQFIAYQLGNIRRLSSRQVKELLDFGKKFETSEYYGNIKGKRNIKKK